MILELAGEQPNDIQADGTHILHDGIADAVNATMRFPSGITADLFVSWLYPLKEQRLVVVGDRGMAVFDDREPLDRKLAIYDNVVEWNGGAPTAASQPAQYETLGASEPLIEELQHFADCVASSAKPRTDGAEGLGVLRVLTACTNQLLSLIHI